jgi:hypothetical protein
VHRSAIGRGTTKNVVVKNCFLEGHFFITFSPLAVKTFQNRYFGLCSAVKKWSFLGFFSGIFTLKTG